MVCDTIAHVVTRTGYEKTLCYIPMKLTFFLATNYCTDKKMLLYVPKSSPTSYSVVSNFAKNLLKGSESGKFFVNGRDGNKCLTINGQGYSTYEMCSLSYHFVCEYILMCKFMIQFSHTQ